MRYGKLVKKPFFFFFIIGVILTFEFRLGFLQIWFARIPPPDRGSPPKRLITHACDINPTLIVTILLEKPHHITVFIYVVVEKTEPSIQPKNFDEKTTLALKHNYYRDHGARLGRNIC